MGKNNRTHAGASKDSFAIIATSLLDGNYAKELGIDLEKFKKIALAPYNNKLEIVAVFVAINSKRYFVCLDEKVARYYRGIIDGENGEDKILRELPIEEYSVLKSLSAGSMDCLKTNKQGKIVLKDKNQKYIIYTPYQIYGGELLKHENPISESEKNKFRYPIRGK